MELHSSAVFFSLLLLPCVPGAVALENLQRQNWLSKRPQEWWEPLLGHTGGGNEASYWRQVSKFTLFCICEKKGDFTDWNSSSDLKTWRVLVYYWSSTKSWMDIRAKFLTVKHKLRSALTPFLSLTWIRAQTKPPNNPQRFMEMVQCSGCMSEADGMEDVGGRE